MIPDTSPMPNQTWLNPKSEEGEPSLVRLVPERLSLAVVPKEDLDKTAVDLENGAEIVSQHIPLSMITMLQGDVGDCDLTVTYKQGESKTDSVTIKLADDTKRDELLNALTSQLGQDWERQEQRAGWLPALRWPLLATAAVGPITWFTYTEAQRLAAGEQLKALGRSAKARFVSEVMHRIEGMLGSTGVLIVGGLLASLCLSWLFLSVAHAPLRITVRPEANQ